MNSATPSNPPPRRIAIFRALQLGDLLCAVPALRALRAAFPAAEVTLIGLESSRGFVARFGAYVDRLEVFPGAEGMPEQPPRPHELPAFFERMRARAFDLAIQLHGTGTQVNDYVARLGARVAAGFKPAADAPAPGPWFMPWPDGLPEPMRYTALMDFLGIPAPDAELEFRLGPADHGQADALVARTGLRPGRTVIIHPGARLPSRRWPVERFAEVAQALRRAGWAIAVTGSDEERGLTARLVAQAAAAPGPPVHDLTGATSLGGLGAMLTRCRLLVCNDTGVSHVAAGVGAPSVVIACGSDVGRWAPLDRRLHPVLAAHPPCRPCSHFECPIGHPCALGVTAQQVIARAQGFLKEETVHV